MDCKCLGLVVAVSLSSCSDVFALSAVTAAPVPTELLPLHANDRAAAHYLLSPIPWLLQAMSRADESEAASHSARSNDLPDDFKLYQSVVFGDRRCAVEAVTDEDGLHQRPYVCVSDSSTSRISWIRRLGYPTEFYQGRATHCLAHKGSPYVILQADTDSHQATNQTVVSVVKLDIGSGDVLKETHSSRSITA